MYGFCCFHILYFDLSVIAIIRSGDQFERAVSGTLSDVNKPCVVKRSVLSNKFTLKYQFLTTQFNVLEL